MREELLERLRCPRCGAEHALSAEVAERDEQEVVTATLVCAACGHRARVEHGIAELMHDPPDHVRREAAGLERFAQRMIDDGWTPEDVAALPEADLDYWRGQKRGMDRLLSLVDLEPGSRLLDAGANTTWASSLLAGRGLDVIALDIATVPYQGLRSAEWFFAAHGVFYERVVATMNALPLASGSLDYVFTSQVLHHNGRGEMLAALREFRRVLRPGGRLLAINEPLRFLTDLKRDNDAEVAEFEGHEHVYFAWEYSLLARAAGFAVDVLPPHFPQFTDEPWPPETPARKVAVFEALARHRPTRAALRAKARLLGPDHAFAMIARKGGR